MWFRKKGAYRCQGEDGGVKNLRHFRVCLIGITFMENDIFPLKFSFLVCFTPKFLFSKQLLIFEDQL